MFGRLLCIARSHSLSLTHTCSSIAVYLLLWLFLLRCHSVIWYLLPWMFGFAVSSTLAIHSASDVGGAFGWIRMNYCRSDWSTSWACSLFMLWRDDVGMWRMRAWRDDGEWHSDGEKLKEEWKEMKDIRKMRKSSNNKFPFILKPNSIWHMYCCSVPAFGLNTCVRWL